MPRRERTYRVEHRVSTRKSADSESPEFEVWLDFEPGDRLTTWPRHLPVDELVESGHLVEEAR